MSPFLLNFRAPTGFTRILVRGIKRDSWGEGKGAFSVFEKGLEASSDPSQEKVGHVLNRDEKKAAGENRADDPAGYILLHARPQVHPACAAGSK